MIARHDGKVLDDPQIADTQPLQQYKDLGGTNQKWEIDLVESGYYNSGNNWVPPYYRFTNGSNGDGVGLSSGLMSHGGVIQQYYQIADDDNQKRQIEEMGGGFFKVVSKTSAPIARLSS